MASLIHRTSERVLIDESKLNGRLINLEAQVFKLGLDGGSSYLEKCKKDENLPLYLHGIIQSGDKPNRNGRVYPWDYLKRECIRYMENEVKNGLSYGECFVEGHKILTRDYGWLDFNDLPEGAYVATMNPLTKEFEWQQIIRKIQYEYEGEVISLKSKSIDTKVTPNHKFFIQYTYNKNKFEKIFAKDLNTSHNIPTKSIWKGNVNDKVLIKNEYGEKEFNSCDFFELLGWYISEGWFSFNNKTGNYSFSISQTKEENLEEIKKLLNKLELKYSISENDKKKSIEYTFTVSGKFLAEYFKQFGKSIDKHIPQIVKDASKEHIQVFINSYLKGDGWGNKIHKECGTVSKKLAEDLLELFQKTDSYGKIKTKPQYVTYYTIENKETKEQKEILDLVYYTFKEYTENKDNYEIIETRREYTGKDSYIVSKKTKNTISIADTKKEIEEYKGNVYCVEVPNHIIYVMNNGIPFWSANCDHPEESATPMLSNACWTIEDMSFKGKDVHAKILVLSAYMPDSAPGKKIRGFLLNHKNVGISSRALGSLEQYSNSEYDIVAEDLEMVCWDAVSNASNYGSEKLEMVQEGNNNLVKNNKAKLLIKESQLKGYSQGRKDNIGKLILTEEERTFLNILGLEEFLRIYMKK